MGNTDNVSWAVFRQPEGPESLMPVCSPGSKTLSVEEQTYANTLVESVIHFSSTASVTSSTRRRKGHAKSSSSPNENKQHAITKPKDKFSLIKDLSAHTFADLAVHVVKMFYLDERVHLYVTDYTVNKSLFDYGDKSDEESEGADNDTFGFLTRPTREKRAWQGPRGRMTLQVTLWDPHSYYARENVTEDVYILLRNVHVKADKMNGLLEGVMHTDKMYPEKVDIRVLDEDHQDDPRIVELKTRKREYWKQNRTNKRKLAEDFGDGDDGKSKKNSKQRRKELQRQKKQQEQRKQQQQAKSLRREEGQTEIPSTMNKSTRPNPHSKSLLKWKLTLTAKHCVQYKHKTRLEDARKFQKFYVMKAITYHSPTMYNIASLFSVSNTALPFELSITSLLTLPTFPCHTSPTGPARTLAMTKMKSHPKRQESDGNGAFAFSWKMPRSYLASLRNE